MRPNGWLRALALAAIVAGLGSIGCGGGGTKDSAGGKAPAAQEALAHADAVVVTYYYLPG